MVRKILVGVLLLILVAVVGGYVYVRSQIPNYDAKILAQGLQHPVTVTRNLHGVPHIQARNVEDLYFVWGYVNAQDRMFQMEVTRRAGQGRIAEFAGEKALNADIFLRAMGFYELAQKESGRLSPWIQKLLQRYVDGVNRYLEQEGMPLYGKLVGFKTERWTVADPIVVGMMLNWALAANMKSELIYHEMFGRLGREKSERLLNLIPPDTSTIAAGTLAPARDTSSAAGALKTLGPLAGSRSASNNWVIGPARSGYAGPILANDPHVESKLPSDFYLIRLDAGDFHVAGGQVAGLPFIPFGYNRHIAWGVTNNGADIVDLYAETIDEATQTYLAGGKVHPLRVKNETFVVKGREPVQKAIHYAGRRPLLKGVLPAPQDNLSLDWIGFLDASIEGFFHLHTASNHAEFVEAARKIKITPQNMVYADSAGNIGYHLVGALPDRKRGTGNVPPDGSQEGANWDSVLAAERNPAFLNPERGFIITANNKVNRDSPVDMNGTYSPRYRYDRIEEMLTARGKIDLAYVMKMQTDSRTVLFRKLLPIIEKHVRPATPSGLQALEILKQWDGVAHPQSAAACIHNTFLPQFMLHTLSDELGTALAQQFVGHRYISLERFLDMVAEGSGFFDDVSTPEKETVGEVATRAFEETVRILSQYTGSEDPQTWEWGKVHILRLDHVLGRSGILAKILNYGPLPFQGDCETNNRAFFSETRPPFVASVTAGLRLIVVFDPQPKGHMVLITGENESFLSPHYTDMTRLWLRGEYFSVEEAEARYKTVFLPAS
jgi:penicillin G amidase